MSLDRNTLFIGGEWAEPAGSALLEVVSPHSEEVVAQTKSMSRRPPSGTKFHRSSAQQATLKETGNAFADRVAEALRARGGAG